MLLVCDYKNETHSIYDLQFPSIEHDEKVIGESLVLLDYLKDNFGGPQFLPTIHNLLFNLNLTIIP